MQDCSNSTANALELLQSCAKLSIYFEELSCTLSWISMWHVIAFQIDKCMWLFDENQIHCWADMAVLLVDCYGIPEHCLHKSLWCSYLHILTDVIGNMTPDDMACFECRALLPYRKYVWTYCNWNLTKLPFSYIQEWLTHLTNHFDVLYQAWILAYCCAPWEKVLNCWVSATNVLDK